MARHTKDWIEEFVKWSDKSEAPTIYRRWCAISAIAAMMKRMCFLEWHTRVYSNMYIVLVGPSGGRKGTAMSFTSSMLRDLSVKVAAEAITREALIRELKNTTQTEVSANGVIYEHCSLTIFSEEFSVFLGHGRDNFRLIADLCDWFDCKESWCYRTKNQGTDDIKGVWVNLVAATTPSILGTSLPQDAIGGGLTSRIIFVYAPGKEKTVPFPFMSLADDDTRVALMADLDDIALLRGKFRFTESFLKAWEKFYYALKTPPHLDTKHFQPYMERKPIHTLKLCMIVSAARSSDMIITDEDFYKACGYLEEAEAQMPKVYSGYGRVESSDLIPQIMHDIATRGKLSKSILMNKYLTELTLKELDDILAALVAAKFCEINYNVQLGITTVSYLEKEG
jgi:hypothetical protein